MQYNFAVKASLTDGEAAEIADNVRDGLQASGTLNISLGFRVNTELPEADEEVIRQQVADIISKKLGIAAEASLVSKEV